MSSSSIELLVDYNMRADSTNTATVEEKMIVFFEESKFYF